MSDQFEVILTLLGGSIVVGALLYTPFYFWFHRRRQRGISTARGELGNTVSAGTIWLSIALFAIILIPLAAPSFAPSSWPGQVFADDSSKLLYVVIVGSMAGVLRIVLLRVLGPRVARNGREFWFSVSPDAASIRPKGEPSNVFCVIMDWPVGKVQCTVIAAADGTSSVYTSRGVAILGGLAATAAAQRVAAEATTILGESQAAIEHPFPPEGIVRFYIRTYDDLRMIEESAAALQSGAGRHAALFLAMNELMTQLFRATRDSIPGRIQA